MTALAIRQAEAKDASRLNAALNALSAHLGDRHRAKDSHIAKAGWGDAPVFRAVLAEEGAKVVGVALYSAIFSTIRGGTGLYVSDLWVAEDLRGTGLGKRLLAAAAGDAERVWDAGFMKLSVYESNEGARAAYLRMGFTAHENETNLSLDAAGLERLRTE
ncbi:GNAT family N-acetyltransferase [Pikeienuella piscinae]|uniref:GNAT family N-acetyltransferase n=1 Tax=Pikeienuella piscinae TaxID=2748098 RepID=A0A7L5C159_9RHOB|nr:GNAT family N-acetyltransferase [Pikeienuella piscinae]QIE55589.1 GNAT family N-acetyltransferase [Pikeienuella piscinae]